MSTQQTEGPRSGGLWVLAFAGPLLWFGDLVASWVITPPAGRGARDQLLHAIQLATLGAVSVVLVLALRAWVTTKRQDPTLIRGQRTRWLASSAVVLSALSLVLVAGNIAVTYLLWTGREP